MTCFYCKGNIESSTTTYMTDYQGCYIIIKNVPCEKCSQCGEEYCHIWHGKMRITALA